MRSCKRKWRLKRETTRPHSRSHSPFAQHGDADAEFSVGILALQGVGLGKKNPSDEECEAKALEWIKKAAEHGNDEAIMYVADAYQNGWSGLPKNAELAACWRETLEEKTKIVRCLELERKLRPKKKVATEPAKPASVN